MADVGLNLTVGADVTGVVTGLNKAQAAVAGFGSKTATEMSKAGNAVTQLGTKVKAGSDQAAFALTNLGRVAQDAPFGFIGIQNNINPLLESFQRLKAETGSTGGALKALAGSLTGAAGIGLAVSVATSLLTVLTMNGFFKSKTVVDSAAESLKKYKEELSGFYNEIGKEASGILSLIAVLKSETETRERKLDVIKQLQKANKDIFGDLKLEQSAVLGVDAAYRNYLATLKDTLTVKILQSRLDKELAKLIELEGAAKTKSEKSNRGLTEFYTDLGDKIKKVSTRTGEMTINFASSLNPLIATKGRIEELVNAISQFSKVVKVTEIKAPKIKVEKADKPEAEKELKRVYSGFKIKTSAEILIDLQQAEKEINDKLGKDSRVKPIRIPVFIEPPDQESTAIAIAAIVGSFEQLGASIGDALSGKTDIVGGFFKGISSLLAKSLIELGKYVIMSSLLISGIKKALNAAFSANPVLGIIAGVGLIAVGTALQNSIPKFATGTQNFSGGMAMVGERGPELVSLPKGSNVIPNDKLGGISGGGTTVIIPNVTLRGQDLIIAFNRASQSNSRTF